MPDQLQAARDEIAEMCGWMQQQYATPRLDVEGGVYASRQRWFMCGCIFCGGDDDHPIPDSLDFVSRVWPDERYLFPDMRESATHEDRVLSAFIDLLDILKSMRRVNRPAFDAACEKVRKEIQG